MSDTQNEYRIVGYLRGEGGEPSTNPQPIYGSIPDKALAEHGLLQSRLENLVTARFVLIELQERTLTDWL